MKKSLLCKISTKIMRFLTVLSFIEVDIIIQIPYLTTSNFSTSNFYSYFYLTIFQINIKKNFGTEEIRQHSFKIFSLN